MRNFLERRHKMDEDMDARELLEVEIKSQIQNISSMPNGTEEKTRAIDNLVKLYKLKLDETKIEFEHDENRFNATDRSLEHDLKEKQFDEQIKDRYFRLGIAAAELLVPLIFYGIWMRKGFKFEENGAYTSTTFRNLFNRFRPTKK